MKEAHGFLSTDDTFFHTEAECRQYEALESIRSWCVRHTIRPDALLSIINSIPHLILDYIYATEDITTATARQEAEQATAIDEGEQQERPKDQQDNSTAEPWSSGNSDETKADKYQTEYDSTTRSAETVQQFPVDRRESVPDMGSDSRTEAIPVKRKSVSSRSRGDNASGVRGDKDLAT